MTALLAASMMACTKTPEVFSSLEDYPTYEGNDLGITYSETVSQFKAWSPGADSVRLNLYKQGTDTAPYITYAMNYLGDGLWGKNLNEDLLHQFYTFQVHQDNQWYQPTSGLWAKAVGVNGNLAAIEDLSQADPTGWTEENRPKELPLTDAIIYEMHVRDMTMDKNAKNPYPGKFLGVVSPQNIQHLKDLGITHVQILPLFDYASIDETKLADHKYNWGYDPKNYNAPEGGYSTNPYEPLTRIKEMKTMIMALHKAGIRVIMDVVYNHTYDGATSPMNLMAPNYFYRMNDDSTWSNGSGCGNETASDRPMARIYFAKSLQYWAKEYHIDGFRFDLMGIHDIASIQYFRTALNEINPGITMYGEGWSAGPCGLDHSTLAMKENAAEFAPTGVFSDVMRDACRGSWTEGNAGGFITGNGYENSVRFSIAGAMPHPQIDPKNDVVHTQDFFIKEAAQVINYVSCHDNECLRDKLEAILPQSSEEELLAMDKLAQTIVFTAQGVPFMQAGEEIFRTKLGVENSYQSPDSVNVITWENQAKYPELYTYYKNLIKLRKDHPAFRMKTQEEISKHLVFGSNDPKNMVSFQLIDHANNESWETLLVIFNGNRTNMDFTLPEGAWTVLEKDGLFIADKQTESNKITLAASSACILAQ